MQIYAQSVHRWNPRTRGYLLPLTRSVFIHFTQRSPKLSDIIMVRYGGLRSFNAIDIDNNRKPVCPYVISFAY